MVWALQKVGDLLRSLSSPADERSTLASLQMQSVVKDISDSDAQSSPTLVREFGEVRSCGRGAPTGHASFGNRG